jgi:hypothetical protein
MKTKETASDEVSTQWRRLVGRRSFLQGVGAVGATLPASALLATQVQAAATLSKGDAAILRFLAAAEILESDLWTQYEELGGVSPDSGPPVTGNAAYIAALEKIDADMPQYITDNTDDELSHAAFLNAYLSAHGAQPVDLEKFRTLTGSTATGSSKKKRLTNLKGLTVDTSWYTRYRSNKNPDFGFVPADLITIKNRPAIPVTDNDDSPNSRIQAIANTAAFHFAMIEQGGASLYTTMCLKASSLEVLRIVVSIGGVEVDHFGLWHDKVANTLGPPNDVTDHGLTFPDLSGSTDPLKQPNKILPEPCDFISKSLPECSVIRPSSVQNAGAMAAVKALRKSNLFEGQSNEFFDTITHLAQAADEAERKT